MHPAFKELEAKLPLANRALAQRLAATLSQLAHWCPVFGRSLQLDSCSHLPPGLGLLCLTADAELRSHVPPWSLVPNTQPSHRSCRTLPSPSSSCLRPPAWTPAAPPAQPRWTSAASRRWPRCWAAAGCAAGTSASRTRRWASSRACRFVSDVRRTESGKRATMYTLCQIDPCTEHALQDLIALHDAPLASHFATFRGGMAGVVWPHLASMWTELLTRGDWLKARISRTVQACPHAALTQPNYTAMRRCTTAMHLDLDRVAPRAEAPCH